MGGSADGKFESKEQPDLEGLVAFLAESASTSPSLSARTPSRCRDCPLSGTTTSAWSSISSSRRGTRPTPRPTLSSSNSAPVRGAQMNDGSGGLNPPFGGERVGTSVRSQRHARARPQRCVRARPRLCHERLCPPQEAFAGSPDWQHSRCAEGAPPGHSAAREGRRLPPARSSTVGWCGAQGTQGAARLARARHRRSHQRTARGSRPSLASRLPRPDRGC